MEERICYSLLTRPPDDDSRAIHGIMAFYDASPA